MSVEIHSIGSMRAWSESTFGADGTGTLGNYFYVPMNEGSATLVTTQDEIDPMQVVQSRVEGRNWVLGKTSASLVFTTNLTPTGTAAASGVTAITSAMGKILKATMGAEFLGTGTTFGVGSTASVLVVTSSAGFIAGSAIGWVNALGVIEWREIEVVSDGTHITVKHAFSGSPASTNVAYAAATYSIIENPSESLQFILAGVENEDRWLVTGGQAVGGVTFAIDPSGAALPTVTFNLTFANWFTSAETAGTITGTLADATYTAYEPIVGYAGECRLFPVGVATLASTTLIHVSTFEWNPKITYVPVPSPAGVNGILRWRAARANPPAEGSFALPFEDLTFWTARSARGAHHLQYQAGILPGYSFLLTAPTIQISNPQRVASGELAGQTVAWRARRDTDVGVSVTELAKSPDRIHCG